jgi:hypothetical protein
VVGVIVHAGDIATALGRDEPPWGTVESRQWEMWISDAQMLVQARLGDLGELDQAALAYVVREAVVEHIRRPDGATAVEVAVDDGRAVRRYSSGSGRVQIRDEWWKLLDPNSANKSAFSVDTVALATVVHADICALRFGALYCSCGAILTASLPLYETGGAWW